MRRLPFLLFAFLPAACGVFAADAPAVPAASVSAASASGDPWLVALTSLLTEHYQPAGELVLAWSRPRPAGAPANASLVLAGPPAALASQILIAVRATDSAGHVTEHALVLRAELWRDGWAAREPAASGDPVRADHLDLRRFDSLRERDALAADPALDLTFARNVPAGRLLTSRDVARRPLVKRGQPVEVSATEGSLTVTLRALSMQDGGRGETVRVRNPETNKEFTAIVTADARAVVRF